MKQGTAVQVPTPATKPVYRTDGKPHLGDTLEDVRAVMKWEGKLVYEDKDETQYQWPIEGHRPKQGGRAGEIVFDEVYTSGYWIVTFQRGKATSITSR